MKPKNILVVTQYFWPENFRINDLCMGLQERGYNITVLTGKPNYPRGTFFKGYNFFNKSYEVWNGIKIYRSSLIPRGTGSGTRLFFNYFSFAFFASFKALSLKVKFETILVFEPSPITVGIPAIVAKWKTKAPVFFWVQDLWPASISAAGGIKSKIVFEIINKLTKFIYRYSYKILVQSKAFIPYIINQGVNENKLIYYPNSTEPYFNIQSPDYFYLSKFPKGFNLLFAGNIGEAQSFDTLIQTSLILKEKRIKVNWVILGEGRMNDYVINQVNQLNLAEYFFFLGSFPSTEMPYYFACADALLVSLRQDQIFSLTIPSKIQSYLACGKPIIGSLDGVGASIIAEANAGFSAAAEKPALLAEAIMKLYNLPPEERQTLGLNGRKYFEREFERTGLLDKLESILNEDLSK